MDNPVPVIFRGVDRAAFAVSFAGKLRNAGLAAGLTETGDLVGALEVCTLDSPEAVYWALRVATVRRQPDLAVFDRVFAAVFTDVPQLALNRGTEPPGNRRDDVHVPVKADTERAADGGGLPWATLPTPVAAAVGPAEGPSVPLLRPSALAALAERPFEDLDAAQIEQLGAALRDELTRWPTRRTRRHETNSAGRRLALRATVALSRRTAWEPVEIVRQRPIRRPRRVVLLCDVSASMQAQAAAYLHLMRAFTTVADAEAFAFATGLTRLTPALRQTSPRQAITQATAAVTDRFGGTRIAANLSTLLDSHHGNTLRGALVIVASDGWDTDPPERLAATMARLRRRAYRILWLNPRAGAPGFTPRVAAMAAALPFCDAMLPAATFADLAAAVRHLRK
ncbi:VWA domain-containing protein [Actinoplanes sp. NPDC051411]|uniref:vWA domain-containing protein n=1 Tax=Actinoplanes sp. NPDC051411 TaxID=3155522 RepID=UPI00342D8803